MVTWERLKEVIHYDPDAGTFSWKINTGFVKPGDIAGSKGRDGYLHIRVDRRSYCAHRLAWLYETGEWPRDQIDHLNGQRLDNRFSNLREATQTENTRNVRRHRDNASGFKGVSFYKPYRKWVANICFGGKRKNLGYFQTPEDAYAAYCNAAEEHHGQFARFE